MSYPVPKAWLELVKRMAAILPSPTGCQIVQAQADALTSEGNMYKDRRMLDYKARLILRDVAKRAAQEAAKAAEDGEI